MSSYPFDPTYGYTLAQLLSLPVPPVPADFAEFWQGIYAQARAIPPRVSCRAVESPRPEVQVFHVEFDSLGEVRIGGWLTVPRGLDATSISRLAVIGHGYGGRETPDLEVPGEPVVAIFPCMRGFHRSASAAIPAVAAEHVVHGIQSRMTYVHLGCAADVWCAASALLELFPGAGQNLQYRGGSFGGGIGALAMAWDHRFHRAFLDVPSFGNHPLRVQMRCEGSGEAVRQLYQVRPQIMQVLRYFDSAAAASFIRIPTLVAAALYDPFVPPPGQFSVYNALGGPRKLFTRQAAHCEAPAVAEDDRQLRQVLGEWFAG